MKPMFKYKIVLNHRNGERFVVADIKIGTTREEVKKWLEATFEYKSLWLNKGWDILWPIHAIDSIELIEQPVESSRERE